MLRFTLMAALVAELLLYALLLYNPATDSLLIAFTEVLGIALLVRLIIIALTFVIARTPLHPLRLSLSVLAAEYYATVYLYSYSALRRLPDVLTPNKPNKQHLPIIFIHGFSCNAGFWRKFVARFQHDWGGHLATISLEPVHGCIKDYAPIIDQRITTLLEAAGQQRCLIVAHSMGGLASRHLLRNEAARARVAGVITLGTPHSGTVLARYAFAENVRQMRPLSTWLEDLVRDEAGYTLPPFEALVGTHDNIVSPQACAALDHATNTYMVGISHLAMALNRDVIDWTLERCERLANSNKAQT